MFDRLAIGATGLLLLTGPAARGAAAEAALVPVIDGQWWQVAGNPDVGQYTSDRQQPVDFAVWQAADGTWQLWSCIRATKFPGNTRLFYRWEGSRLTDSNWKPNGIAMTADPKVGETEGGLQAPYVMKYQNQYLMFYGTWTHIALATSNDGKSFQRRLNADGKTVLFTDPGTGTRDPMTLRVNREFYTYYSANPEGIQNVVLLRTSEDLSHWSGSIIVASGGSAGTGPNSAECPFVYFHSASGYYFLLRTQHYGQGAETRVYRSKDPKNFGINDDRFLVETLPIAAPEIIESGGQTYIAALLPTLNGIRIARLKWVPKT